MQAVWQVGDVIPFRQSLQPPRRNSRLTIVGASDLAADGGRGVRVITQISRTQDRRLEGICLREAPQRSFKTVDDAT